MGRKLFLGLICVLSLAGVLWGKQDVYQQGEVLVVFKNVGPGSTVRNYIRGPVSDKYVKNVISDIIVPQAKVIQEIDATTTGLCRVSMPISDDVELTIAKFAKSNNVAYAQPNFRYELSAAPTPVRPTLDSLFPNQWALENTGQSGGIPGADISAPEGWGYTTGSANIVVAVLDSGINYIHPDLAANMWNDPCVFDTNGLYGWDFAGADVNATDADGDPNWSTDTTVAVGVRSHGTHVAGIIGAVGNNGTGITGVCWNVKMMAVKIFADNSAVALSSDIIPGISYAITKGANVINASFGYKGAADTAMQTEIAKADANNVVFVASAGNSSSNNDSLHVYPSDYNLPNVISVMATDDSDNMAYYSNYGRTTVHLAAPGGGIWTSSTQGILSTVPINSYDYYQGTSMAAPHVTGAVALMLAIDANLTPTQVKTIITSPRTVDLLPSLTGRCTSGGRLNLFKTLQTVNRYKGKFNTTPKVVNTRTSTAYTTIQAAITGAVAGDTLIADHNCVYFETLNFNGKNITLRSGTTTNFGDLTNYESNTFITALSVSSNPSVVTFKNNETNSAVLRGFTISDGAAAGIDATSNPTIQNCTISFNDGPGIKLKNSTSVVITGCDITDNNSTTDGGGIYSDNADGTISSSNFTSNFTKYRGGGMFISGNGPDITNCKFTSNAAGDEGSLYSTSTLPQGGAIYYYNTNSSTNSNSNLTDCEFSQNTAYLDGGAVFVHRGSGLDIKNCLFERNATLSYDGGAIYLESSSPTIDNCTFASNTNDPGGVGIGGAIFCNSYVRTSTVGSSPIITNCIFSGNSYYAVAEWSTNSDPSLQYCLFYNNNSGDLYDYDTDKAYYKTPEGFQSGFDDFTANTNLDSLNIGGDPNFVMGALGNFYLAQNAAGQTVTGDSIALNAGSDTAAALGLNTYQTSTDSSINDSGIVDLGYHYDDPTTTPNVNLTFSVVAIDGEPLTDADVDLTPNAGTYSYVKYSEAELTSVIITSDYEYIGWSGTGSDEIAGKVSPAVNPTYHKVVTMDSARNVSFRVQYALVWVFISLDGNSEAQEYIKPKKGDNYMVRRGTVVELTAIPVNKSNAIIWGSNTKYPDRIGTKNEVVANGGTNGIEIVSVRFYAPRIIPVASDPEDYENIQRAINSASSYDTVLLTGGTYRIQGLTVSGKNITIKGSSSDPNDTVLTAMQLSTPEGSNGLINPAFTFSNVGVNARIEGITIQGFWSHGLGGIGGIVPGQSGAWAGWGGGTAIALYSASPTIENCIIRDCGYEGGDGGKGADGDDTHRAGGNGGEPGSALGGAITIFSGSNPVIKNVTFDGCYAIGGNGGSGGNGCATPGLEGAGGRPGGWYDNQLSTRPSGFGGAIYVDSGCSPVIENCTFTNCYSGSGLNGVSGINGWLPKDRSEPFQHFKIDNAGGAVYCEDYSSPTFKNCAFTNCYADPNTLLVDPVTLLPNGIINDKPFVSYGGAVYAGERSVPVFENCTFTGNKACAGGAIAGSDSDIKINNCLISENTAYIGGGIQFLRGAPIVTGTRLATNTTVGNLSGDINIRAIPSGGAVACLSSNAMIQDSMLMYNETAGAGGAVYVAGQDIDGSDIYGNQETLLWNCLIVNNTAASGGGAIYAFASGEPNIVNCTIADNSVTGVGYTNNYGGGIYCYDKGYAKLLNTIVWGNTTASGNGNQMAATGDASHSSAIKVAYSNIQGGSGYPGVLIDDKCILTWDSQSNLDGLTTNPLFVTAEGYYLSQSPNQTTTSPCVDAGSDTVSAVGFFRHSTNTDGTLDTGTADIGYHYVIASTLTGDLDYDADVDFLDVVLLNMKWLYDDCIYPDWCQGRDINQDGVVNYLDYTLISGDYGNLDPNMNNAANDIIAPTPNPMKWSVVPEANGTTVIYMEAMTAYDNQGGTVEYQFTRVNASGEPSGDANTATGAFVSSWQQSRAWSDTGRAPNMSYSYRVRAKDSKGNQTSWSTQIQSATTTSDGTTASDHTAPTWPASGPWSIVPFAFDSNAPGEIRMRANVAQDTSAPISYRFTIKRNGATVSEYSSDWQTDKNWTAINVFGGSYSVYVEAKDAAGNISVPSTAVVVVVAGDGEAPVSVASPLTALASISGNRVYLTLTSAVPTDVTPPIYYRFTSSNSTYNKLPGVNVWRDSRIYSNTATIYMGIGFDSSYWYVEFMDGAGNATTVKYPVSGVRVNGLKI